MPAAKTKAPSVSAKTSGRGRADNGAAPSQGRKAESARDEDEPSTGHGGARKGAGRPRAAEPRDVLIKVYVTAGERDRIKALAEAEGRKVGDVVREAVLEVVEQAEWEAHMGKQRGRR